MRSLLSIFKNESFTRFRLVALMMCGTGLYFFANIQRVAIPGAVFNQLQSQWQVSAPYITGLGSAFMYTYALNQLLVGILVDRYGGIRLVVWGGILFCLGALLFPLAPTLGLLYTARILTGCGASAIYLSLIKEIMRLCQRHYTIIISLMIMVGYAGGIVAGAPFVAGVNTVGFLPMLLLLAIIPMSLYGLFTILHFTVPIPAVAKNIPLNLRNFELVFRRRHNRNVFLFAGINWGLYYVIQTVIGKKFLEDYCGMGAMPAATVLSCMGIISALSGFVFVMLSRCFDNQRLVFCRLAGWISIAAFGSLTLLLAANIRSPWLAGLFCLLALTGSMSPIMIPLLRETNPEPQVGLSISFMNFSFFLAVALFGNMVGFLMQLFQPQIKDGQMIYGRLSYLFVFAFLLLSSIVVFYCSRQLRETRGKKIDPEKTGDVEEAPNVSCSIGGKSQNKNCEVF